ncbi:MAG: hypothetical protein Q4P16_05690 [Spirochaetales bacterium]|nr:hypothetical protein [Spirochaetales bacterium]
MKHYAILCGSAPDGFTQKKINEMHDFLTSEAGGFWTEKDIAIFPNGVTEAMLSFVLERLKAEKTEQILLYICTLSPVADDDKSVWLGGEEVRKSVIESVASASSATGNPELVELVETGVFNGVQVIYDSCREFESDEETEEDEDFFSAEADVFSKSLGEIR